MGRTACAQDRTGQTQRTDMRNKKALRQPYAQVAGCMLQGFLSSVLLRWLPTRQPGTTRAAAAHWAPGSRNGATVQVLVLAQSKDMSGTLARGSGASGSSSASSACGTLGIARRSHRQTGGVHGNWEGMFLRVVLTGGTRLGEILIRRLVELDHAPSWGREKSRASRPAGSFIR